MSNAVLNAHIMLGYPCGEGADLREVADWAGELIMSGNGGLNQEQIELLNLIGDFLFSENPAQGERESALEAYCALRDSISGHTE